MDGGASVVLYSEKHMELSSWYLAIKERIDQLLDQAVSHENKSMCKMVIIASSHFTDCSRNLSLILFQINLANSSLPSSEQVILTLSS